MAYLAPIHQASSIRHALKLNFLSPLEECLVVAKANRLEFYAQTPDGLVLRHSKTVYGRVTMLNKLPMPSSTDHLFVGTDRFMYFTLSWNPETKQLRTEKSFQDLATKSARDTQTGERCSIDPTKKFLTLELYEGVVTVLPIAQEPRKKGDLEQGSLGDPLECRIEELFVRSSTFFEAAAPARIQAPLLALLYEDTQKRVRLKVRELDYSSGFKGESSRVDLKPSPRLQDDLELGASHLIPVAAPTGGIVILGETSITYYEHSGNVTIKRPLEEATIFVTWEQIDDQRYVLADEYGKLYLFMLELDSEGQVNGWKLDVIGETSRASVLVYLDAGKVFVGSHQGDSQVIEIRPKSLEVVQTFANIAPILDFTVMDLGNRSSEGPTNEFSSGQARLVTGSGAFKDGSLRSVRSGVGLEDVGLIDAMDNIVDLFSIKSNPSRQHVDMLAASFVDETRIFRFDAIGDVEELGDFSGFSLNEGTLLAANVANGLLLQVTASVARLTDPESGMIVSQWKPSSGRSITAVVANEEVVVLSVGGSLLMVLSLTNSLSEVSQRTFEAENQVACVSVPMTQAKHCAVGFWKSSEVQILDLSSLKTVHTEMLDEEGLSIARSLLIVDVLEGHPPTLFAAMADGHVITYTFDANAGTLSGKTSIVLGTQQATLRALPRADGIYTVFATCEHPSLIYGSEGRLVYSAVTAESASCVCSFDLEAYPGAIAIATQEDLKIAIVDEERSTHVQGLHVGETVRRIAYSPAMKAFGLGTIKRTLEDGAEIVESHFKLADEMQFNILATYDLNNDEIVESVIRAPLSDGTGNLVERFIVGTAFLDGDAAEAVRGRILVLEVTEDKELKLVVEQSVRGACRCLGMVEGRIVAALIKTVVIYDFSYTTPSTPFLTKCASHRTSTAPIDISVDATTSRIAIADLMKSVSIVQFAPGTAGKPATLLEVARHYQTTWATAVALVDTNTYLESDAEGNLMVLHQDVAGEQGLLEDQRRMQVTSEMQLGEMVNKIRRIDVPVADTATVVPRAFVATVEGSIYLFALIAKDKQDLLMRMQASMARLVQSPGHVEFMRYRGFKNQVREEREPFRFVDGELIERFLECDKGVQEEIAGELAEKVEKLRTMVEGLRRLR